VTKLLLINGAPRSGKDTAGEVARRVGRGKVHVAKFAKVLKERTHALYGLFGADSKPLPHDAFESVKDCEHDEFLGATPRQAYIAVSEKLMKPLHGDAVFGLMLLQELESNAADADLIVVTDSGFAAEAVPLVESFGAENTVLMRIHRTGCDFNGDSRSLIALDGVRTVDVHNCTTLEMFEAAVSYAMVDCGLASTKGEERMKAV
jgi:hypothetical protein